MLRRIVSAALTLTVCLVSFEAATRIDDWVRFGAPPWSPIAVEEELLTRDSLGEHGKPYARFQKWALNNVGMRGPNVTVPKPVDVLRVVTAGASETFGLYESPGREYPRQLEDSLRPAFGANRCDDARVEVVNAAIFGMSLPSIDQDLRLRVALLQPDVVVLYPTPVQYLADSVPRATAPSDAQATRTDSWYVVFRPRVVTRLRDQLKEVLPSWIKTWLRQRDIDAMIAAQPAVWRFTVVPEDRLASYDHDLRHIIGTIRAIGARPVIMTHANLFMSPVDPNSEGRSVQLTAWQRFYPRATKPVLIAFDSAAVALTSRAAADSQAPVADLADVVRRSSAAKAARLFGDYAHFTDAGSALVAGTLRTAIMRTAPRPAACGRKDNGVVLTTSKRVRSP
jgi:hypothetical protein